MDRFSIGDIVQHFKYELCDEDDRQHNKYLYCIKGTAIHTETNEELVIYQALYAPFCTFARPAPAFYDKVDTVKYPDVKQKHRFEKI